MRYLYKYLLLSLALILSLGLYFSSGSIKLPYKFFLVSSDSMIPELQYGDLVITAWPRNIKVNDTVTFKSPNDLNELITHRVVGENFEEEKTFTTKGDNNSTNDPWQITEDMIVGKKVFSLPIVGYPILLLKSSNVYIVILGLTVLGFCIPEINLFCKELVVEWGRIKRMRKYQLLLGFIRKIDGIVGKHLMREHNTSKLENAGD